MNMPGDHASTGQRRRRPKRAGGDDSISKRENGSQYHLKAITRALDVLDTFDDRHPELTLKDLSKTIDLPESSLFRILLTLEGKGYLIQNPDGAYMLAPKLLLGKLHERAERVRAAVRPRLQELASRFDETASAAYLFEDRIQVIDAVETFHAIRMTNKPGRVLPPHASSLGKVITAFQSQETINRMLQTYGLVRRTERTTVDRQVLLAEFEQIRVQGFAFDREESVSGGICIGAAIRLRDNPVVAALSVSTPIVRMHRDREREILAEVLVAAHQAARDLEV
ncbi:MAG TPA: IclR family transcriptional regulator [Bryobacteraceae bacterium]|nr:IclR family transcriptional regulator [Bryobacteraceae bacterium]